MAYDIGPRIGIDGEKEFRNQIRDINAAVRTTTEEMRAMTSAFADNADSEEALTEKNRILTKQIEQQRQKLELLNRGLEESRNKYGDSDRITQQWQATVYRATADLNRMEAELRDNESALNGLQSEMTDTTSSMNRTSRSTEELQQDFERLTGEIKSGVVGGLKTLGTAALGYGASVVGLVESTKELREDMSKLRTNAESAGVSFDEANEALLHFNAITGETDSSIEAISNLLQADFTGNNLTEAVESLSGAVIRFPDTLKIESLADSLQETLATGAATGQFGEVLERLGYNLDEFDAGLKKCTTAAEKQRYALDYLADAGLRQTNAEYEKNNKVIIENSKAQLRLEEAMADIGQKIAPLVTKGMNKLSDAAEAFADGPLDMLIDAGEWAIDHGEEIISIVGGLGTALMTYKAIKGVSDIAKTFKELATTIQAARMAQEALNLAQLASPIGIAAAAVTGLVAAFTIFSSSTKETNEEITELNNAIDTNKESVEALNDELEEAGANRGQAAADIEAEATASRRLNAELSELVSQEDKTAVEKQRIKNLVDQLNDSVPDLNLAYDEQADSLNKTVSEINNYIDAYRDKAKVQAAEEDLTEATERQYEAVKQVAIAEQNLADAQAAQEEAQRKLNEAQEMSNEQLVQNNISINTLWDNLSAAEKAVESADEAYQEANKTLEEADTQYQQTSDYVQQFTNDLNGMGEAASENTLTMLEWDGQTAMVTQNVAANFETLKAKYEETRLAAETSIHEQIGLFDQIDTACDMTVEEMASSLQQQADDIENWANNLQIAAEKHLDQGLLKELADAGIESAGYLQQIANATDEEITHMNEAWQNRFAAEKYAAEEMAGASTGIDREFDRIVANAEKQEQRFYVSGLNSASGYQRGMESQLSNIANTAVNIALTAVNAFNRALDIRSPSRVFMKSGEYSAEGFEIGWEKKAKDISKTMKKTAPTFSADFVEAVKGGKAVFEAAAQNYSQNITVEGTSIVLDGKVIGKTATRYITRTQANALGAKGKRA